MVFLIRPRVEISSFIGWTVNPLTWVEQAVMHIDFVLSSNLISRRSLSFGPFQKLDVALGFSSSQRSEVPARGWQTFSLVEVHQCSRSVLNRIAWAEHMSAIRKWAFLAFAVKCARHSTLREIGHFLFALVLVRSRRSKRYSL